MYIVDGKKLHLSVEEAPALQVKLSEGLRGVCVSQKVFHVEVMPMIEIVGGNSIPSKLTIVVCRD